MSFAIYFKTGLIDVYGEEENPINPIKGKSLLEWLKSRDIKEVSFSEIEPEDWGWYCDIQYEEQGYMIGASMHEGPPPNEWVFQISRDRSLVEMITMKGRMSREDKCLKIFENIFKDNGRFIGVRVE